MYIQIPVNKQKFSGLWSLTALFTFRDSTKSVEPISENPRAAIHVAY
jgi:hypothetical protein